MHVAASGRGALQLSNVERLAQSLDCSRHLHAALTAAEKSQTHRALGLHEIVEVDCIIPHSNATH